MYCFGLSFVILSFLPQKSPFVVSILIKPSFPVLKLFWRVHYGRGKRFEQFDLTALAMAEPHCNAAHDQDQTCITGKAVAPDSHLLQRGTLPAYTTDLPCGVSHFCSILLCIFIYMISLNRALGH